jgi:large subunit ribosomal protein L14e
MMFEVGRVCMKTAGREAGRYCVVLKKEEPGFVLITGPKSLTKVKRRKCNIHHLEPLVEKIKIKSEAPDDEVLKALKEEKVFEKLGFRVKTAEKTAAEKVETKREKKPAPEKEAPKPKKAEPKKSEPKKKAKPAKKPKTEKKEVKPKRAEKKPAKKTAKKK